MTRASDRRRCGFADFIAPKIECEIAFQLRRDLPPRPSAAVHANEVAAAIESMRLAIEIVDSRWPPGSGALAELADGFNNGALVVRPALRGLAGHRLRRGRHRPHAPRPARRRASSRSAAPARSSRATRSRRS
jgi:2-keto-4-pentenoate hydratase